MTSSVIARWTDEAWQLADRAASAAAAAAVRGRYVVLAVLLLVEWGFVAHEALSKMTHNGWLYYHGGDAPWYWTSAYTIAHGTVPQTMVGYGWPLLLAPLAAIFGPDMANGLPAVIVLDVAVLAPLALFGVYLAAERIAGRLFGLWAAAVWVFAPPLAIHLYTPSNRPALVDNFLPAGLGLNALSDYPSMVCAVVAAYLVLRLLDRDSIADGLLCGTAIGFLLLIKPSNGPFAIAAAVALLVGRRFRGLGLAAAAVVPALIALTLWKRTGLGQVPLLAQGSVREASGPVAATPDVHKYVNLDWHHLLVDLRFLDEVFWSVRVLEFLFFAGIAALLLRSRPKGLFVVLWFLGFGILKGTFTPANVEDASLYRFLQPAWPAWILLVAAVVLLWPVGRERRQRRSDADAARARALRRVPVAVTVAVVALFGVVPLAVAASLGTVPEGSIADDVQHGAIVPVVDFHLAGQASADGTVRLTWSARSTHLAAPSYRVYRGSTDGCTYPSSGAPQCNFVLDSVGTTGGTTLTDRGAHGRVVYRVALQGIWDESPNAQDVLLLSRPLVVDVP